MGARAVWKGVIELGNERVPVKLYSAVEDRTVHFRLLHEPDGVPVERRMVDPDSGTVVAYADTRRAAETDDGRRVVLEPEELESLEPPSDRSIEVLRFLDPREVPHVWYDRPYYLGPDGDEAAWEALAAALADTGLEGVVRWTMRKKRYVGALRMHEGVPILSTLRAPQEVVDMSRLEPPAGRAPDDAEVGMAERLVGMLEGDFDPEAWEDDYRIRVMELIEAKAEGRAITPSEPARKRPTEESLEAALSASLAQVEERKRA